MNMYLTILFAVLIIASLIASHIGNRGDSYLAASLVVLAIGYRNYGKKKEEKKEEKK